jgi:hypothetical protein
METTWITVQTPDYGSTFDKQNYSSSVFTQHTQHFIYHKNNIATLLSHTLEGDMH